MALRLYVGPMPHAGHVWHWPEGPRPLARPPVAAVNVHSAIPGIDFEVKPCSCRYQVPVIFTKAHACGPRFHKISEILHDTGWHSIVIHAKAVSETRDWLVCNG